jgi:CRP/FNR family transcriptional regulator, cyclic AMP receptor protein
MHVRPIDGTLLGYLDAADRDHLSDLGVHRRFAEGDVLLRQGDPTDHVLVLLTGWARVYSLSPDGQETVIALRGPGDAVGELAALHGWDRTASVQALSPVDAIQLRRHQFIECLHRRPTIAVAMIKQMSIRLREIETNLLDVTTLDVSRRVAAYLLRMAHQHDTPNPGGTDLGIPLSQQDIANRVGASLRGVARAMALLRDRGIVVTTRRHIVIARPDVLRAFADNVPRGM